MSTPLDNLVKIGQLKREPSNTLEFRGLVESGRVRLLDAKNTSLKKEKKRKKERKRGKKENKNKK